MAKNGNCTYGQDSRLFSGKIYILKRVPIFSPCDLVNSAQTFLGYNYAYIKDYEAKDLFEDTCFEESHRQTSK